MTKGKSQIGINRLIKPHSRGRFICSRCISPLEFTVLLTFSFKTIANSNRQIRRPCADSVNKFVMLISLINSYLAFSFFSFFYDNVFAIRCISWQVLISNKFYILTFKTRKFMTFIYRKTSLYLQHVLYTFCWSFRRKRYSFSRSVESIRRIYIL